MRLLFYKRGIIFFLLTLSASNLNAKEIVIPSEEIISFCSISGCDNQVFYRYFKSKKNRFCSDISSFKKNKKQSAIISYIKAKAISKGLPETLPVVPMIESSLNIDAIGYTDERNPNPAIGLWQFKPATAIDMGLKVTANNDERLSLGKSTDAGLRYVSWLTKRFDGDHNLAVLSYHFGIGSVERLIAKHQTRNPWLLSKLINLSHPDKDYLLKYYSYSLALMGKGCES